MSLVSNPLKLLLAAIMGVAFFSYGWMLVRTVRCWRNLLIGIMLTVLGILFINIATGLFFS